ncbi:MAG: 50S ribosomal protein L11 methyltransferase [Candidatus Binataceae bacterium]
MGIEMMAVRPKAKEYIKLTVETPAAMADDVAAVMVDHGALGCALAEMVSPNGIAHCGKVRLEVYFSGPASTARAHARLGLAAANKLVGHAAAYSFERLSDPGWATQWQTRFRPLRIGRRFMIVPPWDTVITNGARLSIVIRPGQGFGTGHHRSTYGVLRMLEQFCDADKPQRALDVGTGSGILSLAMIKLGVNQVVAIDCDATALDNARENAELNGVAERINFSTTSLASIRSRFPLITANILSSTLIEMAPVLIRHLASRGCLVLAGILAREAAEVLRHYQPPLTLVDSRTDRGWTALVLRR